MNEGWVKTHRKLQKKGYYKKSEYVHLWIHLLFKASHGTTEFMFNNTIQKLAPGQFITGQLALAEETGINRNSIERILKCFEKEQQIEQQKTNKFRLITIKNWNEYQIKEQQFEQQVSNKAATSEQQMSTIKNEKNYKNIKNNTSPQKIEKQFEENSDEMILTKLLWSLISGNNPKAKSPQFQNWAGEIDKMLRIDGRTFKEIDFIIRWCQQDNFWKTNILSTAKLREKFDQLFIKAKSQWEKQVEQEFKSKVPNFDNPYAGKNN